MIVFQRLRQRWAREREWRREHLSAWSSVSSAGPEQLSSFQADAERAVGELLDRLGYTLIEREIVLDEDQIPTVVAKIQGTGVTVWIYGDGAELVGSGVDVRFEKWDARTQPTCKAG